MACVIAVAWYEALECLKGDSEKAEILTKRLSDWRNAVNACGNGLLDPHFDRVLGGDMAKEDEFLKFIELAKTKLRSFGTAVPAEYLEKVLAIDGLPYEGGLVEKDVAILDKLRGLIRPEM